MNVDSDLSRRGDLSGRGDLSQRGTAPRQALFPQLAGTALCVLLLCFPAMVNRSPLFFPDSRAYYMGGRAAVGKLIALLHLVVPSAAGGTVSSVDAMLLHARGVRSAFYSLMTFVLSQIGTPWLLIVVQALLIVAITRAAYRLYAARAAGSSYVTTIIFMAVCTSLPWYTSFVMPDIFTPIMVLSLGTLLISWQQIRPAGRLGMLLLMGMSLVMHISNLPLAVILMGVGGLLTRQSWRRSRWALGAVAGVPAASVMAMLLVSFVGFGEWTLTPRGAPFLTARSIDDGPGRLYLQEHCPQVGLAMCRHLDKLDLPSDQFIWGQNGTGVYSSVPAEEQAQLRHEDKTLFWNATREHPWMQVWAVLRNAATQLVTISVRDISLPNHAEITDDNMVIVESEGHSTFLYYISVLNDIATIAGCLVLVWLWTTRRLTPQARQLVLFVVAAVLANAVVAGGLSMPTPRYEARIIWLLPFLALMLRHSRSVRALPGEALS